MQLIKDQPYNAKEDAVIFNLADQVVSALIEKGMILPCKDDAVETVTGVLLNNTMSFAE